MNEPLTSLPPGELILYQTDDGKTHVQVRLTGHTVWLTQKLMAELFQKDVRTINEHIHHIFDEGELQPAAVIRNFRTTAADGKNYDTQHYNLDVIISVGYRVKSHRGTQFRIWATQRLREYIGSAKNYLAPEELNALNRIVTAYLEFAEVQALNQKPMYMRDWIGKLDDFLRLSGRDLLDHAGHISHDEALTKARLEYEKYRQFSDQHHSRVEEHFFQAINALKPLPKQTKPRRKKT